MSDTPDRLRIGLLRLADSAPVVVAQAFGLFARHGLHAELHVEPSWANVADRLVWGGLDAAVMFAPLAVVTACGRRGRALPLRLVEPLSRGGNAIVGREAGLQGHGRPRIAVVHSHSTHHLLLRRYLATIGRDPDRDVEIVVMPPAETVARFASGEIDGFCAGAPWGAEATLRGLGSEVSGSRRLMPSHLEKSVFATTDWLAARPDRTRRLRAALAEARALCADPANAADVAALLATSLDEGGLALPMPASLQVLPGGSGDQEQVDFADHGPVGAADLAWMLDDMRRLGWIDADVDAGLLIETVALR